MKKILLIVFSIATIVVTQFGFIFLLLALLPSVVAYFIDTDKTHPAFKIVLACNIAALLPTLSGMLHSLLHLRHYDVGPMMWNPAIWLVIYGGAAAGWSLIFLFRYIARCIVSMLYEYNIAALEHVQKQLVEEWGQGIAKPPL